MSEWPEFQLGDRCKVKSSKRIFAHEYVDNGIPFMRSKDVIDKALGSFVNYDLYISEERFLEIKKTHGSPKKGDVLMSSVGNRSGQPYVIQDEGDFHFKDGNILWLSEFNEINPDYLAYWFKSEIGQDALISVMIGSAQKALTIDSIRKLWVSLPPIGYQNKIAEILKSLDKKIELNRQTNQTLEQIAQAIFKSWFVDFDPVRAKIADREAFIQQHPEVTEEAIRAAANTEGDTLAHAGAKACELAAIRSISGKTEEQLDNLDADTLKQLKATATLFPDALVESEHGEAPEGWEYGTLSEIGSFGSERIAVTEFSLENYISTENMLEGKRGITKASTLPSVKTVPAFKKGHILISNIRPYFMKIWLAQYEGGRSSDVLGIEAEDQQNIEFLYNLLYQDTFFNFMMMTSKGAKMPRGDKDAIMGWKLPIPDLEIRRKYTRAVKNYYVLAESIQNENESLGQLRDTLLPKLLTSEFQVSGKHTGAAQ